MSPTAQKIAILIVEDQDLVRRLLVEWLRTAYPDAVIMEAADGARALQLCRSQRPRLVLMDVKLPDANGIDLTAQVRQMLADTEVIVMSQYSGREYAERARAAGAFVYITKERICRELLPAVGRALARAPACPSWNGHRAVNE